MVIEVDASLKSFSLAKSTTLPHAQPSPPRGMAQTIWSSYDHTLIKACGGHSAYFNSVYRFCVFAPARKRQARKTKSISTYSSSLPPPGNKNN
jgi:hypothetical protein